MQWLAKRWSLFYCLINIKPKQIKYDPIHWELYDEIQAPGNKPKLPLLALFLMSSLLYEQKLDMKEINLRLIERKQFYISQILFSFLRVTLMNSALAPPPSLMMERYLGYSSMPVVNNFCLLLDR